MADLPVPQLAVVADHQLEPLDAVVVGEAGGELDGGVGSCVVLDDGRLLAQVSQTLEEALVEPLRSGNIGVVGGLGDGRLGGAGGAGLGHRLLVVVVVGLLLEGAVRVQGVGQLSQLVLPLLYPLLLLLLVHRELLRQADEVVRLVLLDPDGLAHDGPGVVVLGPDGPPELLHLVLPGVDPLLLAGVLVLEVLVDSVGPLAHPADVDGEGVVDLGCGADGEGVPLEPGHLRDLDEDPVPGAEVEAGRPLDDEVGDPGGEDHAGRHQGPAPAQHGVEDPVDELDGPDDQDANEDLVEHRGVDDHEGPEGPVEEMGAVEDLEVSAASHHGEGSDEDDGQDDDEDHSGDLGVAAGHPEDPGHGGEDPVGVGPLVALVRETGLAVGQADVDGEALGDLEGVPLAELGQLGLPGHDVAAGREVVAHHGPVSRVVLPVWRGELQELDRIGLDIETCGLGDMRL